MAKPPAKKAVKAKGRPPTYVGKDKERIIAHVLREVAGGRAVSRVFREDREAHKLCDVSVFWDWHFADETLPDKLARARLNGVEALMDETIDIADDRSQDTVTDEDGNERPNTEWITRSRLRVDTRHKYAQMIAPRKYGPKLDLTSAGEKLGLSDAIIEGRKRAEKGMGGE